MSGGVDSAHPRLVDGALLGRGEMGSGGVRVSGGRFVISFPLFPSLLPSHSLTLAFAQINFASTRPTKGTNR